MSDKKELKLDLHADVLEFPDGFLWGSSTSAYQVEGGNVNDWSKWETEEERVDKLRSKKLNPKEFICASACDSYNRYKEDFELAKRLNNNAIRLGVEWSRIETKPGVWNVNEIEHYREMLKTAKDMDLKIMLTIWHWTNPIWLVEKGGWANKEVVQHFRDYVELLVKELGIYVDYWVTLNEPMAPIGFGYLAGMHPPGKKLKFLKALKVLNNMAEANNAVYDIIHDHFPTAQSSVTMLSNYNKPARKWCFVERALAKTVDYFANHLFLKKIEDSMDYIGVDYYKMNRFVWYPPFKRNKKKALKNQMGWELYPEGFYHVLKMLSKYNKPLIIAENGTADAKDEHRAWFIREHLKYMHKAMAEGVEVKGYFHWSLLDNFEWARGYEPKFGLFKVDRDTFWRSPRPSSKIYAEICANNKLVLGKQEDGDQD